MPELPPIVVPLRLRAHDPREVGGPLWLIERDASAILHQLASVLPQTVLDALEAILVTQAGEQGCLLRKRASRVAVILPALPGIVPLVPILRAEEMATVFGLTLTPSIRRDVLRRILAPQADRLTIARPCSSGVRWEELPITSARPFADLVEYCPESASRRRLAWAGEEVFPFAPFLLRHDRQAETPVADRRSDLPDAVEVPFGVAPEFAIPAGTVPKSIRDPKDSTDDLSELGTLLGDRPSADPSKIVSLLLAKQREFVAIDGPLDSPQRRALWPQLAELFGRNRQETDAAICWGNALWHRLPSHRLTAAWLRAEEQIDPGFLEAIAAAETLSALHRFPGRTIVLALLVCDAGLSPHADRLRRVLPKLVEYLREIERSLPIRLAWLAWSALARLSGNDVLTLTRARDRLLGELLESGLSPERDLPSFLRYRGAAENVGTGRLEADVLLGLQRKAEKWLGRSPFTGDLCRLLFATAYARLGAKAEAMRLLAAVPESVSVSSPKPRRRREPIADDEAHLNWVRAAYRERVLQAVAGERMSQPLSLELLTRLKDLPEAKRKLPDRIRSLSRILQPHEYRDPFRIETAFSRDRLGDRLPNLTRRIDQPAALLAEMKALLGEFTTGRDRLRILMATVPAAFRGDPAVASAVLPLLEGAASFFSTFLDLPEMLNWCRLLESGLALAVHHDRPAFIPGLLQAIDAIIHPLDSEPAAWLIGAMSGQNFRFLARLGLREDAQRIFTALASRITRGQTPTQISKRPGLNRAVFLPAIARLTMGWFYFEATELAREGLETVRREMLTNSYGPDPTTTLACAYVSALGFAPLGLAIAGLDEFLSRPPRVDTTAEFDWLNRLRIVEAIIAALTAEEFSGDSATRRLLDEEEDLVRRRIHADMRAALHAFEDR